MNAYIISFLTFTHILGEEIERSLMTGNNLFAASVYREISKNGDQNFLYSPFSVETILAFAQSGAAESTAEELRTALRLPDDQNKIETDFKNVLTKFKSEGPYSFHSANKLYLKKDFSVKDGFKRIARDVFYSDVENVEFAPETSKAAENMNKWVEEQTENKIQNLISPDELSEDTVAILINALYFKSNWSRQFKIYATRKRNFYQSDKKETEVDTMTMFDKEAPFAYAENEELGVKFLELPFEGGEVSMIIALPNDKDGIENLEKQIDKILAPQNFTQQYVIISLRKFKIESHIDFKEILQNLGARKAFTRGEADFSGISDSKLVIDKVIQKTFIDVNEYGVEAAAATFIDFELYSATFLKITPKEFYVDHPFIYYIQINGLIVFVGRVGAPKY